MSSMLRGFFFGAVLLYFVLVIYLLRREKFLLKYGILWLFSGCIMLLFAVFPSLLIYITGFLGVQVASNGIFAISVFLIFVMLLFLTAVVTELTSRIREIAQKTAIMEKRLRDMEAGKQEMKGNEKLEK